MTPEEKSLLERTYKMAGDNNTILRKMRRANRLGTAVRILYWLVIIGLSIGAFYYLEPYVDSMKNIIGQAQGVIQDISGTVDQANGQAKDALKTNTPR